MLTTLRPWPFLVADGVRGLENSFSFSFSISETLLRVILLRLPLFDNLALPYPRAEGLGLPSGLPVSVASLLFESVIV